MNERNPFWIIRKGLTFLVTSALLLTASISDAGPYGGVVTTGNAVITQNNTTTTINQSSQNAAINWQSFSIGTGETVNFLQPGSQSITLNRIIGDESSVINGALNANGQVFILNSNGVLFGRNASVNTSGLLATTMSLSDEDFMAGNYTFTDATDASILNMGTISISDSGYAALLGADVENSGTIEAVQGRIYMTGGDSVTINLNGNSLLGLTVDKSYVDALVANSGAVIADGGYIFLTTSSAEDLVSGVVNNTGLLQANSIADLTGEVVVFAHGGEANIGGTITTGFGEGFVETSGDTVNMAAETEITTGNWLIDPTDITIDTTAGSIIEGQLASGDVNIETSDGSINVETSLNVDTNKLILNAAEDITVSSTINVNNSAELDLEYGGSFTVLHGDGVVNMNDTSLLTVNNTAYTIVRDYAGWADMTSNLSGSYALGADIDLTGVAYSPIGTSGAKFTGAMEGLGHTVSNLSLSSTGSNIGLFGYVLGGELSNLQITDASVTTTSTQAGILAGYIENTDVHNVGVSGDVKGYWAIGGLVGEMETGSNVTYSYSSGTVESTSTFGIAPAGGLIGWTFGDTMSISDSYSSATVTGHGDQTGGLVGYAQMTMIKDSYAEGAVYGYKYTGGLVGGMYGVSITDSYATGNVTTTYTYTGGLVGTMQNSSITDSYATGNVSSTTAGVGGLVGGASSEPSQISGSYATGNVSGTSYIGGLVGLLWVGSSVSDSYASGTVTGTGTGSYTGGLIGQLKDSYVTNSYASGNVDGGTYVGSLAGYLSNSTVTNSHGLGTVAGLSEVYGLGYDAGSNTVNGSFYNADINDGLTENAVNVAAAEDDILDAMHTEWDSSVWTGANTNLGVPLLQWQGFTNVALTLDGDYEYGTGFALSDFLADPSGYDTVEYTLLDADGNDVSAAAEAGTLGAGTYTVSVLIDGKYTVTNTGSTITIDKKALSYTLDTDAITYGDSYAPVVDYTGTIADVTGSTGITVVDVDGNDVTAAAEAGTLDAGIYTVSVQLTGDGNYTAADSTSTFTIGQKELGYTLDTDAITYGDSYAPNVDYTGTIADVTGSTGITVVDVDGNDVTAAAEAGTLATGTYTVSVQLTGDGNYTVADTTSTFTIGQKELGYTLDTDAITYGDSYAPVVDYTGTIADVTGSTGITVVDAEGNDVTAAAEAGTLATGTYTVSVQLTGDGNYTVADSTSTFTIGQKELGYTLDTDAITYGDSYAPVVDYAGTIADVTGSTGITVVDADGNDVTAAAVAGTLDAGTYTVSVQLTGDGNYTVADTTSTFSIGQKELGYTLDTDAITYGDSYAPNVDYTGTIADVTGSTGITVVDVDGNDVTAAAEAGTLDTGTYTVSVQLTGDGNYTAADSTSTFTIGQKELGYTLDTDAITYGDSYAPVVDYTGTIADVTGSTGITVVDAEGNDVTAAAEAGTLDAGTYTVSVQLTGDGNYTVADSTSIFTIAQKELGYTLEPSSVEYGTDLSAVVISYEGNPENITGTVEYSVMDVNGDDVTAQAEAGTLEGGEYTISASLVGDNNYVLTSDEYTLIVQADDTSEGAVVFASITPAIFGDISGQPALVVRGYSPETAGEFTQQGQDGASGAVGNGETAGGGEDAGAGVGIRGFIGAGDGFSNSYPGLVEIVNGGIRLPE